MGTFTEPATGNKLVRPSTPRSPKRCVACGTEKMDRRRRYCSDECRKQMNWVLSLSKGLLRAVNARYAVFSFTSEYVLLDVLSIWSKGISRFMCRRSPGNKPAEDLKALVLDCGRQWHELVENRVSRSFASLWLLEKNHRGDINPSSIKPGKRKYPRFSKKERESLKILKIPTGELANGGGAEKIKTAYKKMAKLYHPDVGGDERAFKKLNEAHKQMLIWTENPQFFSRKALEDCWSYDGFTSRWSPPL